MNSNFSTPPATRAEAETIIRDTTAELVSAIDAGQYDEEDLIDQYTRIMSTRLWHDIHRWRVVELAQNVVRLADPSLNGHVRDYYRREINLHIHEMTGHRAWPRVVAA